MKIAFFSDCYLDLTGGIVSSINAQKTALEKMGHVVYVFSTGFSRSEQELKKLARQNIFVVPSCKYCLRGLTPVSRRPKIIEKWLMREHPEIREFDIFYVHYEGGCSIAGLRLGKRLRIPTVQVMHGREDMGVTNIFPRGLRTLIATLLNWFHAWYLPHPVKVRRDDYLATNLAKAKMWTMMVNHANYADLVLTPSEHFRQKLLHYGVKKTIKVLPNGFADEKSPASPKPRKLAPGEELRLIWHSRLSGEKRTLPFFEALSMVKGKYHLDVYGTGVDYLKAKKYAKKHNLNVVFYGDVKFDRLAKGIAEAHLDVMASYNSDTFGMTLIEAEIYGTPVLFCDPDMKEVVPTGGYVLSKSESPEDMAQAIDEIIEHPERIREMSQVMLEHRKEVLASQKMAILMGIFDGIIKK